VLLQHRRRLFPFATEYNVVETVRIASQSTPLVLGSVFARASAKFGTAPLPKPER
jgi:hypothetical protein